MTDAEHRHEHGHAVHAHHREQGRESLRPFARGVDERIALGCQTRRGMMIEVVAGKDADTTALLAAVLGTRRADDHP